MEAREESHDACRQVRERKDEQPALELGPEPSYALSLRT